MVLSAPPRLAPVPGSQPQYSDSFDKLVPLLSYERSSAQALIPPVYSGTGTSICCSIGCGARAETGLICSFAIGCTRGWRPIFLGSPCPCIAKAA